jgi:hypothetical protein
MHSRSGTAALLPLLIGLASGPAALAQDGKIPANPFKPMGTDVAPAAAVSETVEFAGVSQIGTKTHLIFFDKTLRKSRWIALGETVEGITAVRYDARREQATVKLNGAEKILALRKGTGPANGPSPAAVAPLPAPGGFNVAASQPVQVMPAPAPAVSAPVPVATSAPPAPAPATAAPATPESQAKAETEARMLVSDLLEIGMAQRKAYEEAQRRAAKGENTPPAAEPASGTPKP